MKGLKATSRIPSPVEQLQKDPWPFVHFKTDRAASEICIYQIGMGDLSAGF